MSDYLIKKIQEFERTIEISEKTIGSLDTQIAELQAKKREVQKFVKKISKDIIVLKQAVTVIEENNTGNKPYVLPDAENTKQKARNFTLHNIKAKTETIKILKEDPKKQWTCKELGVELFIRDGQDPVKMPRTFTTTVLSTLKRLQELNFVERVKGNERYWKVIE